MVTLARGVVVDVVDDHFDGQGMGGGREIRGEGVGIDLIDVAGLAPGVGGIKDQQVRGAEVLDLAGDVLGGGVPLEENDRERGGGFVEVAAKQGGGEQAGGVIAAQTGADGQHGEARGAGEPGGEGIFEC